MHRPLLTLLLGLIALAGLVTAQTAPPAPPLAPAAPPDSGSASRPASAPNSRQRPRRGGMVLSLHSTNPDFSYVAQIREVAALGATDLSLILHLYQDNSVSPKPLRHPFKTPSDERFLEAVRAGRKLGLEVMVMPIVLLEKPREDDWRGNIAPPDWASWWRAYRQLMLHYARLSEAADAQIFSVGSELSSLEHAQDSWRALIADLRRSFSGLCTYSSNWDHYDLVGFWDALDLMGISGYYELTEKLEPTADELGAAWRKVKAKILSWRSQQEITAPLLFTEIGYASQDGCASKPWNYYLSKVVDLEEQRLCYESFLDTWRAEPCLEGAFFYEWWGSGGPEDHQYTPRGKPAEALLRRHYAALRAQRSKAGAAKERSREPAAPPSRMPG
jgi:hypothetical protein